MEPDATPQAQGLTELLLTLGRLGRTGILTVQGDQQIIGISLLEGAVVSADALNENMDDILGSILTERDLVSHEELASLVAENEAGGGRVMDLLVERSYVGQAELLEVVRQQTYELCRRTLSWETSESKFYPVDEVTSEEDVRPLRVEELLVRVVEDLGGAGPFSGAMPGADDVFVSTNRIEPLSGRDELLLGLATERGEAATELLDILSGDLPVTDVAAAVGISVFEARLALYLLERSGQVRVAEPGVDAPPPKRAKKKRKRAAAARAPREFKLPEWMSLSLFAGRAERKPRAKAAPSEWQSMPPRILGGLMAVLILVVLVTEPAGVLLPFPWQQGLRRAVLDETTSAAYLKIDRAAKTAFLLDGHFPEALSELVDASMLTAGDLVDPAGRQLGYAAQVAGYLVYPLDEGEAAPGTSRTEAVTGNFLLDPEFVAVPTVREAPLVLLD